MTKIGVLGAGTWGMALARMLCNSGNQVTVWSALEREVEEFSATRRHPNLPGMIIPDELMFTKDMEEVCRDKEILLFAVPSPFVRSTARKAAAYIQEHQIIVDVAKGIEADTQLTMTGIIADELKNPAVKLVALSGPTHAEEVAKDMPTTIVSACEDAAAANLVQEVFTTGCMRVYTNDDVHGVELCGALKNVIALASGIATGLGCGDNARAALITRGIAEISRLGAAMGCREQTFGGLAGIGDLIVTATSMHSRNNRCGMLLGQGLSREEATQKVGMVVEGLNALPAALRLAQQYGVEMPIVETVDAVVSGKLPVEEAVHYLMTRGQKSELNRSAFDNKYD
jgi:glycerol-3-phosphate dehydrogenase (NAD(P)+)